MGPGWSGVEQRERYEERVESVRSHRPELNPYIAMFGHLIPELAVDKITFLG